MNRFGVFSILFTLLYVMPSVSWSNDVSPTVTAPNDACQRLRRAGRNNPSAQKAAKKYGVQLRKIEAACRAYLKEQFPGIDTKRTNLSSCARLGQQPSLDDTGKGFLNEQRRLAKRTQLMCRRALRALSKK